MAQATSTIEQHPGEVERATTPAAALAALGIVYGDLGTSPLYTLQTIISAAGGHLEAGEAIGILSLVFWALVIIVSVKYCIFVMRADNHGEGGILALMSLIGGVRGHRSHLLIAMGLFGAALIYGDGIITPAISVLSALEGVNVATDALKPFIMPIAVAILVCLFSAQTFGTAKIGRAFGPIMLAWFVVIGVLGAVGVVHHPRVLAAVNPWHAGEFLARHGWGSFAVLGGVFLAVTGGEALYADMGHVGRSPIRSSWYCIVLPALLLSYAGQTALLLDDAGAGGNPFFRIVPSWGLYPMVVLATAATIIASQAIITGAYSLTRQGIQLGWFPGLNIRQTSDESYGQIYVPFVNWTMMAFTMLLTVAFQSSDRLAGAYGTAVSTTMWLTTALLYNAMRQRWGWSALSAGLTAGCFLVVDLAFFGANILKIRDGGWIPLLFGAVIFVLMTTWRRGIEAIRTRLGESEPPPKFLARILEGRVPRVPGTAVFLTRLGRPVSPLIVRHVAQFGALHETVVSLVVTFEECPRIAHEDRVEIEKIADGFWHLTVHYGFVEVPNLPAALALARDSGCDLDLDSAVWFAAHDAIVPAKTGRLLVPWRRVLFGFMHRNAFHIADRFDLPTAKISGDRAAARIVGMVFRLVPRGRRWHVILH